MSGEGDCGLGLIASLAACGACGALARRCASGVPFAHVRCGRAGRGLALRLAWRRGEVSLGPAGLIAPRDAGGPHSTPPRASGRKVPRSTASLRSKPRPTLPVGAFAVGRKAVSAHRGPRQPLRRLHAANDLVAGQRRGRFANSVVSGLAVQRCQVLHCNVALQDLTPAVP